MASSNADPHDYEIAKYLESILLQIKDAINSGEWASVMNFFAPDFTCEPVFQPSFSVREGSSAVQGLVGLEEYIAMCKAGLPSMRTEIGDAVTDVERRRGRAASWVTFRTVGMPAGVLRHSVGRFQWRRIQGEWKLTSHMSARGMEVE